VAHRTARLNVFGRQLLVTRIELEGWPAATAAEAQGISRTTAHKWIRRYRSEGWRGLEDRSSRPHRSPSQTAPDTVRAILTARVDRRWGPHRLGALLGQPRSTVYAVLARSGYSRLRDTDRLTGVPVRYVHDHPGSLVHQDHKKLGRIPDGGGHRVHGRAKGNRVKGTARPGMACVHNAVDVESFPVGDGSDGYLLFLGRFSPDKGAHLAIDVAHRLGMSILLAGKIAEPGERRYFDEAVRPHLGPRVCYVGPADDQFKRELFRGAEALLFPISWEEPFGLVMVEAMACGTPVITRPCGAAPEVVAHGRTGFVVDSLAELVEAVKRIDEVDRAECRRHVEERFSVSRMTDGYEAVYRELQTRRRAA